MFLRLAQKKSRDCVTVVLAGRIMGRETSEKQWKVDEGFFRGAKTSL